MQIVEIPSLPKYPDTYIYLSSLTNVLYTPQKHIVNMELFQQFLVLLFIYNITLYTLFSVTSFFSPFSLKKREEEQGERGGRKVERRRKRKKGAEDLS